VTNQYHGAGLLVDPDLLHGMLEQFGDYTDVFIVQERIEEAQVDPTVMHPLADLRASLQTDGLLDD